MAASIQVDGLGWWQNRAVERSLANLRAPASPGIIDANSVEDAVFFLMSAVAEEGYLRPIVTANIVRENGETLEQVFDLEFRTLLPRPLRGVAVDLHVERGLRYYFDQVEIVGNQTVVDQDAVRKMIVPKAVGFSWGRAPLFTPSRLRSGLEQVELLFRRQGYADAAVTAVSEHRNDSTGAVDVAVKVESNLKWTVAGIEVDGVGETEVKLPVLTPAADLPWTAQWEQDVTESVRKAYYKAGFPDVDVSATRVRDDAVTDQKAWHVHLTVQSGPQVTMSSIRFTGADVVIRPVLIRRADLEPGSPLNPLKVDDARRRLARLRSFSKVSLRYDPEDGEERTPVFDLTSRAPWETNILLGYGSYEQVRGGFEVRGYNLLHRAHQLRIEAIGSLKSLRGDMVYSVPEVFGESIDGSLRLFGLDREELSFQRREYGVTFGLSRRHLPWLDAEGTVSYTFQDLLNADSELATRETDIVQSTTASVTFGLSRDERDNPLSPRQGYRWAGQLEVANSALGGEVAFQRSELSASWHHPLGESSWFHSGISHGTVLTMGEPNDLNLPVNKRFFPGGDNSYRGLQNGEAAPRDDSGTLTGAKSYTLLNLEFEQALSRSLSAVLFWDTLAVSARLADFPKGDLLYAVGMGLRYRTIIGPVRIEYGQNLNRRTSDPRGTWHFSLGYPF